jgi:NAD(P)-dependent dehydrogenase (short-subunit alcohol dehydrogenase family)
MAMMNELLRRGHHVIGACRNPEGERDLWEIKRDWKERFDSVKIDVADHASVVAASKQLVNNAGVLKDGDKAFRNLDMNAVQQSFAVNSLGPMVVTNCFMAHLERSADPKVVNMTSLMGSLSDNKSGGYYAYRMSKSALNMFSVCLAREFPKVTVLAMHPGWVKTAMGGPQAPTAPEDSASGIIDVVTNATLKDSGRYLDFRGRELPW